MAAANVNYTRTGYAVMSLCLPEGCMFTGRMPATERLVSLYDKHRRFPRSTVPIEIKHGIFLGGMITSDTLTGSRGLLNHTGNMAVHGT